MFCPEMKIKRMLEGCANYFLYGNTRDAGILSAYKDMSVGKNEIPLTSCDDSILEKLESGEYEIVSGDLRLKKESAQKSQRVNEKEESVAGSPGQNQVKQPTRMEKIQRHKHGDVGVCRVDIDGYFEFQGKTYVISKEVVEYGSVQTKIGPYYAMDTVYIFMRPDGSAEYCDQGINPIDSTNIREVS